MSTYVTLNNKDGISGVHSGTKVFLSYEEYAHPVDVLQDNSLSYNDKISTLKFWRDERTRFLMECCRDMDYGSDAQIEHILQALRQLHKEPRRFR